MIDSLSKEKISSGFTIVELLIVIVVIGILAAITIVAFNGTQQRARDTQRKSDLANLVKATKLYAVDKGDNVIAGCGSGGTGTGWLSSDYDGVGPLLSINACLSGAGFLPTAFVDPSGATSCSGLTCHAYMKCNSWYLANLETLPQTSTDSDVTGCASYDTGYGMNYVVKVD